MSRWRLETSEDFDQAARRLDKPTLRRIKNYLTEVCELEDPRSRGRGLTANWTGYWRPRIGDYRVIVEIVDDELRLIAITLGYRSRVH